MANALPQKHLPLFLYQTYFASCEWTNMQCAQSGLMSYPELVLTFSTTYWQISDVVCYLTCFSLCTVAASHFATCLAQFFNAIQAISDLLGSLWCPLRSVCLPAAFLLVFHVCMKGWGGHRTTVPPNINNLDGITIQLWLKWSCQNYSFTQWTLVMVQCYWTTAVLAILKDYNTKLY